MSKNGKLLNDEEADEVWDKVLKELNYLASSRTSMSDHSMPLIRFVSTKEDREEDYEQAFKNLGIELGQRTVVKREKQAIDKTIEVFIPVRYLNRQIYLCKNMIDELRLSSPAGHTDLYDENDVLASFSYRHEVSYSDEESFVYLRRDLLEKYLKDNQLTMFSIVWGERDYYPIDGDWMNNSGIPDRKWATFYEAIIYKPYS